MSQAKVLAIAGGGGGGYNRGGGGGAGGFLYDSAFTVTAQAYTVTVGGGGAGGTVTNGGNGSNSVFSTITATGGGGGGGPITGGATNDSIGQAGGSGGGGAANALTNTQAGGAGTAGQGNDGGDSTSGDDNRTAGGGGGAGAVGGTPNGATGTANSITGSAVTYAGGGGGGDATFDRSGGGAGTGGAGGGGVGGEKTPDTQASADGGAGTANLGGGGGGGGRTTTYTGVGGAGGSGIVIVAYTTSEFTHTGGNSTGTNGTETWVKFTSSGTLTLSEPTTAPTVTTQAVTSIEKTTATGNGNITATGGANATRRGFAYTQGTTGDPVITDSIAYTDGDFGTGAYTKSITGLTKGLPYRVRAYATNSAGTSYGATVDMTTLSDTNLTNNIVSYWKLDGNSNDSVSTNDGTDTGITYPAGKINEAAQLTGTSRILIPSQSAFNLQSSFTILSWVYQTNSGKATSYEEKIVSKDDATSGNRCFVFMVSGPKDSGNVGKLRFLYDIVSNLSLFSTSTISLNEWTLVGIVSTNGTYTFYKNGTSIGNGSTNITPVYQGTASLGIGGEINNSYVESMIGKIDEVGIWDRALTAAEVTELYNGGAGLQYPFAPTTNASFLLSMV